MTVGISIRINVEKIDKARLYKGAKGTYLDLTTFVDLDTKDQYDNNGFIKQSTSKEERDAGVKTEILGNVKVFSNDNQAKGNTAKVNQVLDQSKLLDDDIPFQLKTPLRRGGKPQECEGEAHNSILTQLKECQHD